MRKTKLLAVILCLVLVLSLFAGCQSPGMDATQGTNPSTEPTQLTEATVPSNQVTEPSSEPTEPPETVCPRTIEFFKSHLTPYMTYGETREIFGRWDKDRAGSNNYKNAIWELEDGYYVEVAFYPTANEYMDEYLATAPTGETNPDGTPLDELYYFKEWNYHMKAYKAELCRNNPFEVIEVWFDFPNPWLDGE